MAESSIEQLINNIRQLSTEERRTLLRRLRVSGLLDVDTLMTDQNRLHIAPALGSRQSTTTETWVEESDIEIEQSRDQDQIALEADKSALTFVAPSAEEYQSPISGRVVVHSNDEEQLFGSDVDDPHAMMPVPGQAPERPIGVVFDGGSRGNPGVGYGSYALDWPGLSQQIVKLRFGNHVTNNEAEYDTLIGALEAILKRLADQNADPQTASVEIHGDSQLVINQVKGEWKVKNDRMRQRCDRVQELLQRFGQWTLTHHDRSNSVRLLGH